MNFPNLNIEALDSNTNLGYLRLNELIRIAEILMGGGVKDYRTSSSAPGSPTEGDRYIIAAASPSGDWSDANQYDVAIYLEDGWWFFTPKEGWRVWVDDENRFRVFDGTDWDLTVTPV